MGINRKVNCIHEHGGNCHLRPVKKFLFIKYRESCPYYWSHPAEFNVNCENAVPIPRPNLPPPPPPPPPTRNFTTTTQTTGGVTMHIRSNPIMPNIYGPANVAGPGISKEMNKIIDRQEQYKNNENTKLKFINRKD